MKTDDISKDLCVLVKNINTMKGLKADDVGAFVVGEVDGECAICKIDRTTATDGDVTLVETFKSPERLIDFLAGYYIALIDILGKKDDETV